MNVTIKCKSEFNLNGKVYLIINNKKYEIKDENINIKELIRSKIKDILDSNIYPTNDFDFNKDMEDLIEALMTDKVKMLNYRGIGKSTFLRELSKEFNIPIITSSSVSARNFENGYSIHDTRWLNKIDSDTILVDDITIKEVYDLRNKGFKVSGIVKHEDIL